jgi:signal transduction histidine kinase
VGSSQPDSQPRSTGGQQAAWAFAIGLVWLAFLAYPAAGLARHPSAGQWLALAAVGAAAVAYVRALRRAAWHPAGGTPWVTIAILVALGVALPFLAGAMWLGIGLYAAVLAGMTLPPARGAVGAAASALITLAAGLAVGAAAPQVISVPLLTLLTGAVAIGTGGLVRMGRELLAARQEAERLAIAQERLRLARELHDAVKQQVFVAALEVGAAQALLPGRPAAAGAHLSDAAEAITQAQQELSALISGVRPAPAPTSASRGLATELREQAARWSRRHAIPATVDADAGVPLSEQAQESLLRAAQEALMNVARHSKASMVRLTLRRERRDVTLTVRDDGIGFSPGLTGRGQGLRGIQERLEAAGGTATIDSVPGTGTTLRLTCPALRDRT